MQLLPFKSTILALVISVNVLAAPVPVIELEVDSAANVEQIDTAVQQPVFIQVQQLQDEIRNLRGLIEQQAHRLIQLENIQLERYRDLDRRLSGSSEETVTTIKSIFDKKQVANSPADTYQKAFALVKKKDFSEALPALQDFVDEYPNSDLVADAYYWQGEIYHYEGKLEQAREVLALTFQSYPKHEKIAKIAYKLAVIYNELGDSPQSQKYSDYVLKNHMESNVIPLIKALQNK